MKLYFFLSFMLLFFFSLVMVGFSEINKDSKGSIPEEASLNAAIHYHYEDSFTQDEKDQIVAWLDKTSAATQDLVGSFPFDLNFYLHRSDHSSEPVPWANTQRNADQGVHFHIDCTYPLSAFLKDWTAPHEISHLAIPFVGKSNSWFAEGFATYMQNVILLEMGECTQADIDAKYKTKFDAARPYYQADEPFAEVAMSLRKRHRYPEMYWGGALYFVQLNEILESAYNTSLSEILTQYQACCRSTDSSLNDVLSSWDSLVEGQPASQLMKKYTSLPAREIVFPQ
jgi:hypothetical protein